MKIELKPFYEGTQLLSIVKPGNDAQIWIQNVLHKEFYLEKK